MVEWVVDFDTYLRCVLLGFDYGSKAIDLLFTHFSGNIKVQVTRQEREGSLNYWSYFSAFWKTGH
jgi:hypothetical protein